MRGEGEGGEGVRGEGERGVVEVEVVVVCRGREITVVVRCAAGGRMRLKLALGSVESRYLFSINLVPMGWSQGL